jgi:CRP/FNR family transcriptional regulator, anaerobic regulatory protein
MRPQNFISCKQCGNQTCFFNQYSSSIDHSLIESKKQQSDYLQGQYIIHEGDPIHGIFFVGQGKVKIFTSGLKGTPQIVRLAHAGESLCFRGYGRTTYLSSSVTLEDSRICFLETKDFMEVCNISQLSMHLISYLGNELEIAEKRLKYLMQMNVREKTAEALLFMEKSFGINDKNELDVYMSRKDVAAIAGTSEELIIRQLSDFEKEKLIERRDHGSKIALLDIKRLNQLISKYNIVS